MEKSVSGRTAIQQSALEQAHGFLADKQFLHAIALLEPISYLEDRQILNCLGFAWVGCGQTRGNDEVAARYYRRSAELGSAYGQQGLAACLSRLGHSEEALEWLKRSSDNGRAESSRLLFWHFKRAGRRDLSLEYLARSAQQGHVLSAQGVAWNKIFGSYGFAKIPEGFVELVRNSPKTLAYANDYIRKHPGEFKSGVGRGIFR